MCVCNIYGIKQLDHYQSTLTASLLVRTSTLFLPCLLQLLIPKETPLDDDIDFERLGRFEMSGGNIKSAVFRAASRAALRKKEDRRVKMTDLEDSAEEEVGKSSTRTSFRRQDSDTARMYN